MHKILKQYLDINIYAFNKALEIVKQNKNFDVFEQYYILGKTREKICEDMHYSNTYTITKKKNNVLHEFINIFDILNKKDG